MSGRIFGIYFVSVINDFQLWQRRRQDAACPRRRYREGSYADGCSKINDRGDERFTATYGDFDCTIGAHGFCIRGAAVYDSQGRGAC